MTGVLCAVFPTIRIEAPMSKATQTLLAFAGLLALSQTPAHATEYPYCMTYVEGWSGAIERCDFSTLAQCQASASGLNGSCTTNWRFAQNRRDSPDIIPQDPATRRSRR